MHGGGGGHVWQGVCMVGVHAWQGACMVGVYVADTMRYGQ